MDEADVISFDVFDTLLCRRVLRPTDVFRVIDDLLGKKDYIFSKERMRAEASFMDGSNPTLHEIYQVFKADTGVDEAEIHSLFELEIETERRLLKRREAVCSILERAVHMGKRVIIISDMYFTQDILTKLLADFGITGYERLYVSSEYRKAKSEGLFELVKAEINDDSLKWLHIGDNVHTDIYPAQKAGIETFRIYGTVEMLESSIYSGLLEKNNSQEENIVSAYFAAEAFNDPFGVYEKNGKLVIESADDLGRLLIAPVVFKYLMWLIDKLKNDDIDLIVFPSRDGYILKIIYDYIKERRRDLKLPDSVYLYTSRRAALVASAYTKEDVHSIIDVDSPDTMKERIHKRFEIEVDVSESFMEELMASCGEEREAYQKYLKSVGVMDCNCGLVDFVAMGTVQEALEKLTGQSIRGYYFARRSPDTEQREKLICNSLYQMGGDFQMEFNIYRFYYFMETVITSYEPTFKKIDKDGKFCFFDEKRNQEELDELRSIHNAIFGYCRDMLDLFPDISILQAEVDIYDTILGFFSSDYTDIDKAIVGRHINYDEFMEKKVTDMNR
jgi:predicted HAD superfamily hydrolase